MGKKELNMMSFDILFYPKPKNIQLIITEDQEKQQISTFEKLDQVNSLTFLLNK